MKTIEHMAHEGWVKGPWDDDYPKLKKQDWAIVETQYRAFMLLDEMGRPIPQAPPRVLQSRPTKRNIGLSCFDIKPIKKPEFEFLSPGGWLVLLVVSIECALGAYIAISWWLG